MSKRRTSKMWNHFDQKEETKAECRYCHILLSTSGGSIGNLKRHLNKRHPAVPLDRNSPTPCIPKSQSKSPTLGLSRSRSSSEESLMSRLSYFSSPSSSVASPITWPKIEICDGISEYIQNDRTPSRSPSPSPLTRFEDVIQPLTIDKSKSIDAQLLNMICKEYYPFSLIEEAEFKKFVALLCPGYSLPSRKNLTQRLLPQAYNEMVNNVKINLGKATAVALSTDRWTLMNKQNFIAIAAHYISPDDGTSICSNLLGCVEFSEQHINLAEILQTQCVEWEIEDKITAIVTDNAANLAAAVRSTKWKHILCYAHSLNSIAKASVKPIESIIEKFKSIVQYFKKNSTALLTLHSVQKQMGLPELKLKQDVVPTRWNSTYEILKRVSINKVPILSTLAILDYDQTKISSEEWVVVENALTILQLFDEITNELSSDNSVTLSKAMILTRNLYDYVSDFNKNKTQNLPNLVTNMCTIILMKISEKFISKENPELMYQATLIDPRFKKTAFINETTYKKVYDNLVDQIQEQVSNEMTIKTEIVVPDVTTTSRVWDKYDEEVAILTAKINPKTASVLEMDKFIAEPLLPRMCDPLIWWEQRKLAYPHLYKLALRILCIPASSVSFERVFSKAVQTITEKRSRLGTSKLSKILLLNSNCM